MKHPLQSVALVVMACLVIPPALAEGLCLPTQDAQSTMACCSSLTLGGPPGAGLSMAQSCGTACCSVAPQKSTAPLIPDKLRADSRSLDAPRTLAPARLYAFPELRAQTTWVIDSIPDLQTLLQTFRI